MIKIKQLTKTKSVPFVSNILNLQKFEFPKNIENDIAKVFGQYFINNSNWSLTFKDDTNKTVGWLSANVRNNNPYIELDTKAIDHLIKKYNHQFITEFLIFQSRITEMIKSHMDNEFESELIAFSSLKKSMGIGSQLIKEYEGFLKKLSINKYCLFTDDNCDYVWYINHQYRMIGKYQVRTDDLTILFKPNTKYYVYKFFKYI